MLEKDMENLIANYPDEVFPDAGFKLVGQQERFGQCRVDVVFTDKYNRTILIEIKRGTLSREAAGQVMEYYGLLKQEKPEMIVELVLCANTIPHERREFLERYGIECKEIGIAKIKEMAEKYGYVFLESRKPEDPMPMQQGNALQAACEEGNVMVFQDFEQWLSEHLADFRKFSSLGGRSYCHAKYNKKDGSITVKNSSQKSYTLKHDAIERIFTRCKNAPVSKRYKTHYYLLPPSKEKYLKGEYTTEYWVDPPDMVATPSIPSVIKYWVENVVQ